MIDILRRHSSFVNTGIVLLENFNGSSRTIESKMKVDALFFTRVHFDVFGVFFPRPLSDLHLATTLLINVYFSENLTFCITGNSTSLSSFSSSSLQLNSRTNCNGISHWLYSSEHWEKVYRQERTTLRRFTTCIISRFLVHLELCVSRSTSSLVLAVGAMAHPDY